MIDDLLDHLAGDNDEEPSLEEIEEMFDVLMQTSDAEFQQMPQELVNMLYSLAEAGALPEELEQRVRKLFLRKQNINSAAIGSFARSFRATVTDF